MKKVLRHSANASSSRARHHFVYLHEIEESVLQLIQILQQDSLTEGSISDLKTIMDQLGGQPLPLPLGTTSSVLNNDFWRDWDEYVEAYSHHVAMQESQ